MRDFTHLHVHTDMSLRDGIATAKQIIGKAAADGMRFCAKTDHGTMMGTHVFYEEAKKNGIIPIIGCEAYFVRKTDIEPKKAPSYHLTLLAMNNEGYRNLNRLCSEAHDHFYKRPRMTPDMLEKYSEGLIAMSACLGGEIPQLIMQGHEDMAEEAARWYEKVFNGEFYYEIMRNGYSDLDRVNEKIIRIAGTRDKLVATNDTHYLDREDAELRKMVSFIAKNYDDSEGAGELWFRTRAEMEEKFSDMPELLDNTMMIAEKCSHVDLERKDKNSYIYPAFSPDSGKPVNDELRDNARAGLKKLGLDEKPEYRERLETELSTIIQFGYATYLLIVADIIGYAKKNGIPVGVGRGSAAGSLVCYCLGITGIDPLPYNLLFQRFINPERVSLPDIDMDFCQIRRGEIVQYLVNKYGADKVASIATINLFKQKSSIRAIAQSMRDNGEPITQGDSDRLANAIADMEKRSLDEIIKTGELDKVVGKDPLLLKCLHYAARIEGSASAFGIHPAGVVISDIPINDVTCTAIPRDRSKKNIRGSTDVNIRYVETDMTHAESNCGLIKMDLLGLLTTTIIAKTLDNIKKRGLQPPDVDHLPMDNADVYKLYGDGNTFGLFQVEGDGITQFAKKLKPTCFEDIIALLAIYRPGPLGAGMVDSFIRRKHGEEPISYFGLDEFLEPILKPTYGVIIYQEQVMQIAQKMAGFTLGKADLLRRAMGKKKQKEMDEQREVFINGSLKNGISEKDAAHVFDMIAKFAEYGFNKSHTAAYAYISYTTAWLKTMYPLDFIAALMECEENKKDGNLGEYLARAREMGEVSPPDIMSSDLGFSTDGSKIFYGLSKIKSCPSAAIDDLIKIREEWKKTGMPRDLVEMMAASPNFNLRFLDSMNSSGALDSFIGGIRNRGIVAANSRTIMEKARKLRKNFGLLEKKTSRDSEYAFLGLDEYKFQVWSNVETINEEKETLGFCFSGVSPFDDAPPALVNSSNRVKLEDIGEYIEKAKKNYGDIRLGENQYMLAMISNFIKRPYKNNPNAFFFSMILRDENGEVRVKGFDDSWQALGRQDLEKRKEWDKECGKASEINNMEISVRPQPVAVREILEKKEAEQKIWRIKCHFKRDSKNRDEVNIIVDAMETVDDAGSISVINMPAIKNSDAAIDELEEIKKKYSPKSMDAASANPGNAKMYLVNYGDIVGLNPVLLEKSEKAEKAFKEWRKKYLEANTEPRPIEKHSIKKQEKQPGQIFVQQTLL